MTPVEAVAAVAAACAIVDLLSVAVSIATDLRVWPPGRRDWRYWLTWGCWYPGTAGFVAVGAMDWGSLGAFPPAARLLGGVSLLVGLPLAFAAIFKLGLGETEGLEGELQTGGLYRYSRNPQYLGDLLAASGWVLLADSGLTLGIGAVFVLYYLLLPLAEEPWLRQEYGEEYEEYLQRVPRFFGMRSLERLLD